MGTTTTAAAAALCFLLAAAVHAVAACDTAPTLLSAGTVLLHATPVKAFSTKYTSAVVTHKSADKAHPYSPAWFAAGNNPTFSLHVGARLAMHARPGAWRNPSIYLYSYRTARQAALTACATHADAFRHVKGLVGTPAAPPALDDANRHQDATGFHFCRHHAAANAFDGYTNGADAVRGEREYVLCNAHSPAGLVKTGRVCCRVRATKTPGAGNDEPTLWVRCLTKAKNINGGRWYVWNLNGSDFIRNFQDAGTATPSGAPRFRELVGKSRAGGRKAQQTLRPLAAAKHFFEPAPVVLTSDVSDGAGADGDKVDAAEKKLFERAATLLDKAWPLQGYAGPASDPR